jgi:hypothetical protein
VARSCPSAAVAHHFDDDSAAHLALPTSAKDVGSGIAADGESPIPVLNSIVNWPASARVGLIVIKGYGAIMHTRRHSDVWSAAAHHSGDMAFELCCLIDGHRQPPAARIVCATSPVIDPNQAGRPIIGCTTMLSRMRIIHRRGPQFSG